MGVCGEKMSQQSSNDSAVWDCLVESHKKFVLASGEFFSEEIDRVSLMRHALRGKDRATAVFLLPYLKVSELKQLFNELVFLASFTHGEMRAVRDAILSLPREWVIENIETAAEPLLRNGTYEEYRRLLELLIEIDRDIALKLAHTAAEHPDYDIREAGEDFLERLRVVDNGQDDGQPDYC